MSKYDVYDFLNPKSLIGIMVFDEKLLFLILKTEGIKLSPNYSGAIPPQMQQQQHQHQANVPPPHSQTPSMYHQQMAATGPYQPSGPPYYEMREPPIAQPQQVYLQSNQQAFVTNSPMYHQPPQQNYGHYMHYGPAHGMDMQHFPGHMPGNPHGMLMRTAVGARGGSVGSNDHSDLLKKPSPSDLSVSIRFD